MRRNADFPGQDVKQPCRNAGMHTELEGADRYRELETVNSNTTVVLCPTSTATYSACNQRLLLL
jgi:hypothetical protein